MTSYNLNQSDFSVDILDLFYQNEEDDIFYSLRKKLDLSLDNEMDGVILKNVNSYQPLNLKREEDCDLSGQKRIWEKINDWIKDNPVPLMPVGHFGECHFPTLKAGIVKWEF